MSVMPSPQAARRRFRWGVPGSADPRWAERIFLSNRLAALSAALSFAGALWFPFLGMNWLSVISLGAGFSFAIVPLLNLGDHPWAPRFLLLAVSNIAIAASVVAVGKVSGIQLMLLPVAWLVLVLFDWEERLAMAWGVGLNSLVLALLEAFGPEQGMFHAASARDERLLHFAMATTAQTAQVLVVFYFFMINRRKETDLAETGEDARKADKAKSQFLANMSHEIRTPLNGILGMSSLLMKSELRPEQKEQLQSIQSSGLDLMGIIGEILDLSKIEAGKMNLERTVFALDPLLESVLRPFEHEARRKGLTLRLETGPGLPASLIGDPIRLKQVLNNLVGNALKFTSAGGVTLRVRSGDASPAGAEAGGFRLDCEVEDTGVGIPEADREGIFQSSSRTGGESPPKYQGTGLGLFLSKQIVDMMGGRIGFRSDAGAGSAFRFEIPFPIAPAPDPTGSRPAEADPGTAPDAAAHSGPRLLIVEDHPLNQKVLSGFLMQAGFRADLASGGAEALKAFAAAPYDLILMDCHMPGMDGFECTRALRGPGFAGKRPVILGVTADAMAGTREKCLEAGMDDVITKPILSEELHKALTRWLGEALPGTKPESRRRQEPDWVDERHLREMDEWIRTYDPRFWDRAQEQFRASSGRLITSMRDAFAAERYPEAAESAHALKGLCLMMGLSRMGQACKSLEAAAAQAGWEAQLSDLESCLEPSLAEMRKRIGQT